MATWPAHKSSTKHSFLVFAFDLVQIFAQTFLAHSKLDQNQAIFGESISQRYSYFFGGSFIIGK